MNTDAGKNRLKRLLVLNWRDPKNPRAGGAEIFLWAMLREATASGVRVCVVCAGFEGSCNQDTIDGIAVHRIGSEATFVVKAPIAARRFCVEFKPDLILEVINKIPLLHSRYNRIPVICFVNHLFGSAAGQEVNPAVSFAIRQVEALMPYIYRKNLVLAGSESTRVELMALGMKPSQLSVTPYGIPVDRFTTGIKTLAPSLLYVGRIKRYKGLDFLVHATKFLMEQFPDLKTSIVGIGDDIPRLRQMVHGLKLSHAITFHGYVSEEEKIRLYQEFWVMCFPSCKEGFGLTVAEAALCGTPTVGFSVPGLTDSVVSGQTGELVPYGDQDAFNEALMELLANTEKRNTYAIQAREHYRDFSEEASGQAFLERLQLFLNAASSYSPQ